MKAWQLVTAAALGYVGFQYYQKNGSVNPSDYLPDVLVPTDRSSPTTPAINPNSGGVGSYPLLRGSRGDLVRMLQVKLSVKPDGIFGPATETALYQRFSVKQIDSSTQMKALFTTGAAVIPSAAPVKAPAASVRPLIPVNPPAPASVPAKKPTKSSKPASATPAVPAKPSTPVMSGKVATSELEKVFNAFWDARSKSYRNLRSFIDLDTIKRVLAGKSDADLKTFVQVYNARYRTMTFMRGGKPERATPTLLYDMQQVSQLRSNYDTTFTKLLQRVKRLS